MNVSNKVFLNFYSQLNPKPTKALFNKEIDLLFEVFRKWLMAKEINSIGLSKRIFKKWLLNKEHIFASKTKTK